MSFNTSCSGHYSRTFFHNNSNYKKQSHQCHPKPKRPTKSTLKYQQRLQAQKVHTKAVQHIENSEEKLNRPLSATDLAICLLEIPPVEVSPQLSLISVDQDITPESNLYIFGTQDDEGIPYTLWVIKNTDVKIDIQQTLMNTPLKQVLEEDFFFDVDLFPEVSETLKGFAHNIPEIRFQQCKVKDDPVLTKVLFAFDNFKLCAKHLVSNRCDLGVFKAALLN